MKTADLDVTCQLNIGKPLTIRLYEIFPQSEYWIKGLPLLDVASVISKGG